MKILVNRLIKYSSEEDWFDFKENWYDAGGIGEYISSMSNSAAMVGRDTAYLVWGVSNDTHELTDTTFDYHVDVKNEPLEHYLARQIIPDINFEVHEFKINKKKSCCSCDTSGKTSAYSMEWHQKSENWIK